MDMVEGVKNPADLTTKALSTESMDNLLKTMGLVVAQGKSFIASSSSTTRWGKPRILRRRKILMP